MPVKLRKSKQRDRILELLQSDHIHVTANWVYDNLRGEFPSLSLGNVYRNLNILVEQGLANRLALGSTYDVYEARREAHLHFICDSCGAIEDLDIPTARTEELESTIERDGERRINAIEIHGLCSRCNGEDAAASGSSSK